MQRFFFSFWYYLPDYKNIILIDEFQSKYYDWFHSATIKSFKSLKSRVTKIQRPFHFFRFSKKIFQSITRFQSFFLYSLMSNWRKKVQKSISICGWLRVVKTLLIFYYEFILYCYSQILKYYISDKYVHTFYGFEEHQFCLILCQFLYLQMIGKI